MNHCARALRAVIPGALVVLATALPLGAQQNDTGRIIGRVLGAENARPLPSAQVYLADASVGTVTDLDGRFVLNRVPAGTHDVTVQMLGYGNKTVTGVEVVAGRMTPLDVTLEEQALEVEGITVSAVRERGSTAALLDQRRNAEALVEAVGSAEIGRRPDSDAADVAQRMTGVTVSEGKYVFVRGLGERYSQTSLNGSSLPSPEPEKSTVPLDLFPSGFLESLETQKSYTPDLPADFSGGTVKINTKDFPDRLTVKVGLESSFNTESQFQDGFRAFPNSGTDFIGFDDGSRDLPSLADRILGGIDGGRLPSGDDDQIAVGESLRDGRLPFTPGLKGTPLNRSFDLSVGGRTDAFGDDGEIGYFVAGTYSDSYTRRIGEVERKWRTTAFMPGAQNPAPNVDYVFDRGTRNVTWGTIANVTVKPGPAQKISFRTTVNVNTEDEAREFQGTNSEDINGIVRSDRSRFLERLLLWAQLSGEHQIGGSRLDWRATAGRANRDEPFLREALYLLDDETFFLTDEAESGKMFWTDLVDDDIGGQLDWRVPFELGDEEAAIKIGGSFQQRSRDFAARRLFWDFLGNTVTDIDAALDTATIVAGTARRPGEFGLREIVEPGDLYDATDDRYAGYVMLEVPVGDRLNLIGGARLERYLLGLTSRVAGRDTTLTDREATDVAPSLNAVFSITDDLKVRAAASRTLDRPEFRELAPFQFTEAASLRQIVGNPDLESATITSADLRLDWFPRPGEVLSIGGFLKEMEDPIEQVFIAAASSAYSYQNAKEGTVYGVEAEADLRLDRLSPALESFRIQSNFSWIESDVEVIPGGGFDPTNLTRPLEGQASYVLNAGLNWLPASGWEAGVFYNRFGERLEAAGGSGLPDIYEQPRDQLDATLGIPLPRGARARIKASNILDESYRWLQSANGVTRTQREYEVGTTISVGLSWELQ